MPLEDVPPATILIDALALGYEVFAFLYDEEKRDLWCIACKAWIAECDCGVLVGDSIGELGRGITNEPAPGHRRDSDGEIICVRCEVPVMAGCSCYHGEMQCRDCDEWTYPFFYDLPDDGCSSCGSLRLEEPNQQAAFRKAMEKVHGGRLTPETEIDDEEEEYHDTWFDPRNPEAVVDSDSACYCGWLGIDPPPPEWAPPGCSCIATNTPNSRRFVQEESGDTP